MAEFTEAKPFEFEGVKITPWVTESGVRKATVESARTVYPMNLSTARAIHAFIEAERDEWRWTNDEHTEARRGRWVAIHNFGDVWHYRHEDFPGIFWDSHEDGTRGTPTILNLHDTLLAWKSAQEQPDEPTGLGAVVEVDGRRFVRDEDHDAYPWHEVGLMNAAWEQILERGPVTVLSPGVDA